MTGEEVFRVLSARGVKELYHANSVKTSVSLLLLGGLASRGRVEKAGLPQTNQITDTKDRDFGIWNDVFLDTVDIHDRTSNRNHYGPVLFVLSAEILLNLPPASRVLMTRSNPSKWNLSLSDEQRYFMTEEELEAGVDVGRFDHMLVIRTGAGIVPFQHHLKSIILDEPKYEDRESIEFQAAVAALEDAGRKKGVETNIIRRECSPCGCIASYSEKTSRIPWFFGS